MLNNAGYIVETASEKQRAVEKIKVRIQNGCCEFELILAEHGEILNAGKFLKGLRAKEYDGTVIALFNEVNIEEQNYCYRHGVAEIIIKGNTNDVFDKVTSIMLPKKRYDA